VAPRSQLVRLSDILDNINAVAGMIEGVDLGAYRRDLKLRRAVERCVEIVSDYPSHPWDEIAGIGNLLRHHYERIDDVIMWQIATRSLPQLKPIILAMIEKVKS
jgi:uncharacterized protein with HEPN domain